MTQIPQNSPCHSPRRSQGSRGQLRLLSGLTLVSLLTAMSSCGGEEPSFRVITPAPLSTEPGSVLEDGRPSRSLPEDGPRDGSDARPEPAERAGNPNGESPQLPPAQTPSEPERPHPPAFPDTPNLPEVPPVQDIPKAPDAPPQAPQPPEPPQPPALVLSIAQAPASAQFVSCAWVVLTPTAMQSQGEHDEERRSAEPSEGSALIRESFIGCTRGKRRPTQPVTLPLPSTSCTRLGFRVRTYANPKDADLSQPTGPQWARRWGASGTNDGEGDRSYFRLTTTVQSELTRYELGYEDSRQRYEDSDKDHNDLILRFDLSPSLAHQLQLPGQVPGCQNN